MTERVPQRPRRAFQNTVRSVTDERGNQYFKEKDFETIVYPFVSSRKGITGYLLNLGKILKSIIYLYKSLKKYKPQFLFTTGAYK